MVSVKVKFCPFTTGGSTILRFTTVWSGRYIYYTDYKLFASEWDCHSEAVVLHVLFLIMKNRLSFCTRLFFVELLLLDPANQVSNCLWRFLTAYPQLCKELLLSSIGVEEIHQLAVVV